MEREQLPAILAWTFCVGATAVAVFATSKWWHGGQKQTRGRKPLGRSPGIRVVRVQEGSTGSHGQSWWGQALGKGEQGWNGGATKWEQSKQKGDLGYYFAHHTSMKELAPEDYRMNGPRLLSKGDAPATAGNGTTNPGSASPPPPAARRRAQQITSYSWEDHGEEVRLTFRQPGWDWATVEEEEIGVEWAPRRFRLSIDSREYGLHTIDLPRLKGELADVRVLKMKKRLVVGLLKGGRGSYSKKAPWDKLQSAPAERAD